MLVGGESCLHTLPLFWILSFWVTSKLIKNKSSEGCIYLKKNFRSLIDFIEVQLLHSKLGHLGPIRHHLVYKITVDALWITSP